MTTAAAVTVVTAGATATMAPPPPLPSTASWRDAVDVMWRNVVMGRVMPCATTLTSSACLPAPVCCV